MICDRCRQESIAHTMSMFNTEMICMKCKKKEQAHPLYEQARDAEAAAVANGNLNYRGVGKPADL